MCVAVAVLLGLLVAANARGHIVPVLPSTCAFDPLIVEMPATGLTATTAPEGPADGFRILYDPEASVAQFDLRTVPPRSFATTVRGSVSLSGLVTASLRDDGDLAATPTFTFATDAGNATVSIAVTFRRDFRRAGRSSSSDGAPTSALPSACAGSGAAARSRISSR